LAGHPGGLKIMAENYLPKIGQLINSPDTLKYINSGRIKIPTDESMSDPKHSIWAFQEINRQLAVAKDEDKRIANYYELATGQKADDNTISKYVQYAKDPEMLAAAINKTATLAPATGGFKDTINATVQEKMGRPATEAELGYFGKQMEQGNLDAYGLQDFLQGTSEYQTKYADTARTKLAGELGATDTEFLGKVQKGLDSKYAAMGRPGASAFGSALIGAGKDLATQRTGYLADIGYQSALGGQESLKAAYQNRLTDMYNKQQGVPAAQSTNVQRYYSQQDYDRQAAAQERLARLSQPKQGSFLEGVVPGLVQGGLGVLGSYMGRARKG
jgi:hypothetical protein